MDWKDSPVTRMICYCGEVTKGEIIRAIRDGAKSVDDIKAATGACAGLGCVVSNPSGRSCADDVRAMVEYYGDLAEKFRNLEAPPQTPQGDKSP